MARATIDGGTLQSRQDLDPARASPGVRSAYLAVAQALGFSNVRLTQFSLGRRRLVLLSALAPDRRRVYRLLGQSGAVLAKGARRLNEVQWDTALASDPDLPALQRKVASDGGDWVPVEATDLPEPAQDLLVAMQEDDSVGGVEAFTLLENDRTFFLVAARDDGNQHLYRVFTPDGALCLSGKRPHAEMEWDASGWL